LIDACGIAKLTDFGSFKILHKFVESEDKKLPTQNESVYWSAPEVIFLLYQKVYLL